MRGVVAEPPGRRRPRGAGRGNFRRPPPPAAGGHAVVTIAVTVPADAITATGPLGGLDTARNVTTVYATEEQFIFLPLVLRNR